MDKSQLSEEQLQQLEHLTFQAQQLADPQTLQQLEQSASQMVKRTAWQMQQHTIEPSLFMLDKLVNGWLWRLVLGALLLITAVGVIVYFSLRQLRQASRFMATISQDYRIVHRDQLRSQQQEGGARPKNPRA